MTPEEFIVYIDNLPDDCIDERTEEQIIFHLPKKKYACPACGSTHTLVDKYRKQVLKGIPGTTLRYIYRVRRYRCNSCGKTFPEENPFWGRNQQLFGNTLKRLRGNKKISIAEMIRLIDVPQYIYQDMEKTNPLPPPTMEIAEKIAQILSTSVEEIWGDRQKLAEDIRRVTEEKELKEREKEQERYANAAYQERLKELKESLSSLTIEERSKLIQWWDRDVQNAALENGDKA